MELFLISDNKVKISLTKADLDSYSITCDSIDYDNTETRRVFWTLLDEVNKKTGFDAAKSRVFIQIYPDKTGGCEIYVSRIKGDTVSRSALSLAVNGETADNGTRQCEVFSFDNVEDMLSVCRRLMNTGYSGKSAAYTDENGRFYLTAESGCESELYFITEYGIRHTSPTIPLYIKEHCREICLSDAVGRLGRL